MNNVVYRRGDVLLVREAASDFGMIEAMTVSQGDIKFMLTLLDDVFDEHRHAYEVHFTHEVRTVSLCALRDVHPLPVWRVDGTKYVVPKWYVP